MEKLSINEIVDQVVWMHFDNLVNLYKKGEREWIWSGRTHISFEDLDLIQTSNWEIRLQLLWYAEDKTYTLYDEILEWPEDVEKFIQFLNDVEWLYEEHDVAEFERRMSHM